MPMWITARPENCQAWDPHMEIFSIFSFKSLQFKFTFMIYFIELIFMQVWNLGRKKFFFPGPYYVPLTIFLFLNQYHIILIIVNFIRGLKLRSLNLTTLFFFFKIVFDYSSFFAFHIHFRVSLSIKNKTWILIKIALNKSLEKINIIPFHELNLQIFWEE